MAAAAFFMSGSAAELTAALVGHQPEVRVGSFGASATAAWEGDSASKWDVAGGAATKIAGGNRGVTLPFVPQAGHVYTISADVNPNGPTNDQWFGLGFAADSGWGDSTLHYPGATGLAWLSKGGEASTSLGPGYSNVTDPGLTGLTNPKKAVCHFRHSDQCGRLALYLDGEQHRRQQQSGTPPGSFLWRSSGD